MSEMHALSRVEYLHAYVCVYIYTYIHAYIQIHSYVYPTVSTQLLGYGRIGRPVVFRGKSVTKPRF